jgi:hypothetical protein
MLTTTTITLGTTNLSEVIVSNLTTIHTEKATTLQEVESQIAKLCPKKKPFLPGLFQSKLPVERNVLSILKRKRDSLENFLDLTSKYSLIDPEFLTMSNQVDHSGQKIHLPKFSIYPAFESNTFKLCIQIRKNTNSENPRITIGMGGLVVIGGEEYQTRIPIQISKPLFRSTQVIKELEKQGFTIDIRDTSSNQEFRDVDCSSGYLNYLKKQLSSHSRYMETFMSQLNIIVPETVKKKISRFRKSFGDQVYFVAETKSSDWNIESEIQTDPLVIGITEEGHCALIDHFNNTPSENHAKKEFSSGRPLE